MTKPTIGQRDTFYHGAGISPAPAEVVHVWSDTCVNLKTDEGGMPTSVLILQPGMTCSGYYFVPDKPAADLEAEIAEKASKAPRVTPADVEAEILVEHYFITAADGYRGAVGLDPIGVVGGLPLSLLTFCVIVLKNGFTVTGESACASPENFDAEIGRKVARTNAVGKIWPLLGFRLRDKLAAS